MGAEPHQFRLDLESLQVRLRTARLGKAVGWANEVWDSIDSTNNRAAELIQWGAPEGVIVLARQQTLGRGRQGRQWISPPDSGIYASFILRPSVSRADLPFFTLACGVAASRAIWEALGLKIGLKWVNDLIADGKKVGGILAEMPSQDSSASILPPGLILGIGINVQLDEPSLPDELQGKVDWLERLAAQPIDCNLLLAVLAKNLEEQCDLIAARRFHEVLDAWRANSVTLGRDICAFSGTETIVGRAVDITQDGGLIVQTTDGHKRVLHAGEVTIRGADGKYT